MFGFKKKSKTETTKDESKVDTKIEDSIAPLKEPMQESTSKKDTGSLSSLSQKLAKTRRGFKDHMADFFLGKKDLDSNMLDELETTLLSTDVGIEATTEIIDSLQSSLTRKALSDADALRLALAQIMQDILKPCEQPLLIDTTHSPYVVLVVGINGAGKTTSIGKLAHHFQQQGHSVLLAAGDTFRAAAVDQLKEWGARNDVAVIAQDTGSDPASVIYDAIESASAKNIDVVIADTAGRLHTQSNLMDELEKIKRVMGKVDATAPHEVLLVMDAGFGQNALLQAQQFNDKLGLTGLAVTKLDGTAKGGILFAIASKLGIPIRFIGVGEGIEDLKPFHAEEFVQALLN